jgi:hypothetical protein
LHGGEDIWLNDIRCLRVFVPPPPSSSLSLSSSSSSDNGKPSSLLSASKEKEKEKEGQAYVLLAYEWREHKSRRSIDAVPAGGI